MKAEVNSRSSPTSYTHSLQQLIGCGELFSTRHKKTPEVAKLFHSQAQEGEKKSIKVEWKVWGEKKIDLTEKLQIYTVLGLRNIAEQVIAGVNSQQKLLRGKAAQVAASGASSLRFVLWPCWVFVVHQFSGRFTSKIEHKKCIFLNKFTSLAFFFPTFCPFFREGSVIKIRLCNSETTDQN